MQTYAYRFGLLPPKTVFCWDQTTRHHRHSLRRTSLMTWAGAHRSDSSFRHVLETRFLLQASRPRSKKASYISLVATALNVPQYIGTMAFVVFFALRWHVITLWCCPQYKIALMVKATSVYNDVTILWKFDWFILVGFLLPPTCFSTDSYQRDNRPLSICIILFVMLLNETTRCAFMCAQTVN